MKVLVTGGSGLLGRAIVQKCKTMKWEVISQAFSRATEGMVKIDLRNKADLTELIVNLKPDFIVHAAAERFPDKVENEYENTCKLNIQSSSDITTAAKIIGARVLYISTDYVFDGSSAPYKADDEAKPLNKYGITKLEGEKAVIAADQNSLVLRVPVLYGQVEFLQESAVTCLLPIIQNSSQNCSVSHYEKRYPAHTKTVAKVVCELLSLAMKDSSVKGVYQYSGHERLTKYEMCVKIANVFSLPHTHIISNSEPSAGAPRPYDSQMDNSKLEELGINFQSNFDEGIKECLSEWVNISV